MAVSRRLLAVAGLVLALGGIAALVVSEGRAQQTRPVPTVEQAYTAAVTAQVALAAYQMDNAGLHELAEMSAAGTIPSGALGRVRRARIVVAATQWPDSMKSMADEFVEHAMKVEAALQAENAAAAAPDAEEIHDIGHELSDKVYEWLAGAGGSSVGDGHSHPYARTPPGRGPRWAATGASRKKSS
jgi:hypothetical protein